MYQIWQVKDQLKTDKFIILEVNERLNGIDSFKSSKFVGVIE